MFIISTMDYCTQEGNIQGFIMTSRFNQSDIMKIARRIDRMTLADSICLSFCWPEEVGTMYIYKQSMILGGS